MPVHSYRSRRVIEPRCVDASLTSRDADMNPPLQRDSSYAPRSSAAMFAVAAHSRPYETHIPLRRRRSMSLESSASSQSSTPSQSPTQSDPPSFKRPRPSPVERTPGFIILRPSSDGVGLRVAATSSHSFTDALDALRHRTAPEMGDSPDDGDCFAREQIPRECTWPPPVLHAPSHSRAVFACPVDGCTKKYTFTSNLRRHMRKAHNVKRTGQSITAPS